jgi:dCMP deaminase
MVDRITLDEMYMNIAHEVARRSSCGNSQVGCIVVKDRQIIAEGYNGTPTGWHTNECEDCDGKTKDIVLHSEANAITKLARCNQNGEGATMYCTLSPCMECAKLIVQSGIKRLVYYKKYRKPRGLGFLQDCGVITELYNNKQQQ